MKQRKDFSMKDLLRRLQLGFWSFRTLHDIRRRLAYGSHMYVAGLLAAAALGFAIKDGKLNNLSLLSWPVPASSPEKLRLVPGLQNLGNNCFLNVILQALASCVFFQPFLQKLVEEFELHEGMSKNLPLTVSLAALLEELSTICLNKVVLSPRKVMLALAHYTPNFNLTSQQDAAEAFLHLLSSLKEEISDYNHPHQCSLVNVCASDDRIITSRREKDYNELERWQDNFLGPFDGILGSVLTCQSCSSQISLSFESFHSLPLSPLLNGDSIVAGCTLLDCLKQFIAAEKVENYRCSYCRHNAGVEYLSSIGAAEMEIEKIMMCDGQDSCDCHRLHLEKVPWSNKYSCTLKQLSIAHCPKILCIHLKRVSLNVFGESLKLQGHISFPLIFDLHPFMLTGVEVKDLNEQLRRQPTASNKKANHGFEFVRMQFDTRKLKYIYGLTGEDNFSRNLTSGESMSTEQIKAFVGETSTSQTGGSSETLHTNLNLQSDATEKGSWQIASPEMCFYRLVSVVEHFGRAGSGHYTVYRRFQDHPQLGQDLNGQLQAVTTEWFYVSDSEVHLVSEKEVLAAEATLLFYERTSVS